MATKFAAREVLVLATEDAVPVSLIARTSLAWKAWKTLEPLWEKPLPCSFSTRRISWVAEDELQEEDHLGKQSFVPKAILHW